MYDREELEEWVEPLAELAARSDEVYAMFNNNRLRLRAAQREASCAGCSTSTGSRPPAPSSPRRPAS